MRCSMNESLYWWLAAFDRTSRCNTRSNYGQYSTRWLEYSRARGNVMQFYTGAMRKFAWFLCGLIPAAGFCADPDLLAVYSQFREAGLDPHRVASVTNLELKKDAATFRLKSGTLYFLKPVL